MNEIENSKDYLRSLKSIETENYIDRIFYRPIGYKLATRLEHTSITPNMVTLVSIFIGIVGAALFYYTTPWWITILAIVGLVFANILDCVDGQLARLKNIKTEWGRILDGIAGYTWFLTLYIAISIRMYESSGNSIWFWIAALSMISHACQAALTDLYKTFHLRFISKEKGKEFETYTMLKKRVMDMPDGISKKLMRLYLIYTKTQSLFTPELQKFADYVIQNDIEDDKQIKKDFRVYSSIVMKLVDLMTFNGRTIPLFIAALTGYVWFYFIYEIVFLWIVFFTARNQHETICRLFHARLRTTIKRNAI